MSNMDEWMGAVDCIVTKAGPGTIAEAMVRGLPIMLSAFLPGQEVCVCGDVCVTVMSVLSTTRFRCFFCGGLDVAAAIAPAIAVVVDVCAVFCVFVPSIPRVRQHLSVHVKAQAWVAHRTKATLRILYSEFRLPSAVNPCCFSNRCAF